MDHFVCKRIDRPLGPARNRRPKSGLLSLGLGAAAFLLSTTEISGAVSFEAAETLPLHVEEIAYGGGTWLVAWTYPDFVEGDRDIYFSRSTDGARSWSAPQPLNPATGDPTVDDREPVLTVDASGVWVAAWVSSGSSGGDADIRYSRSVDQGATWSVPLLLNTDAASDSTSDAYLRLESRGSSTIVAVWTDIGTGNIESSRSTDSGATWTSPVVAVAGAGSEPYGMKLVTDGQGRWLYAWSPFGGLRFARSTDDGATWSTTPGTDTNVPLTDIGLATDRSGIWVVTFNARNDSNDLDSFFSRSIDNGSTWSPSQHLDFNADKSNAAYLQGNSLEYDASSETWVAAWQTNGKPFASLEETDSLYAESTDGGQTWEWPSKLVPGTYPDAFVELWSKLATDGSGTWAAIVLRGDGYSLRVVSHLDCASIPAFGCKQAASGGSGLRIKTGPGQKDTLTWKWRAGEVVDPTDIGNPAIDDDYVFCLYDETADTPRLVFEKDIAAGGSCDGIDCWAQFSNGYRYRDRGRSRGAVSLLDIRSGPERSAKVKLQANGAALAPAPMPFLTDPKLTAQLVNRGNGACWEAEFPTATINDEDSYKAKSIAP